MKPSYLPENMNVVVPYLSVRGAASAMEFYTRIFGAREISRLTNPDGSIAHAEFQIGNTVVFIADENVEWKNTAPPTLGGSSVRFSIYVEDVDAVVAQAIEHGATLLNPISDQFYGERTGRIEDPFGHIWLVGTFIEDVSPEEMQRRMDALMQQTGE